MQAWLDALRTALSAKPIAARVNGHCMTPWLRDGATVHLSAPMSFYWPGDVVVVSLGAGRYAVHRVIGCYRRQGEWRYVTQGDRALRPDPAVTGAQILGRIAGGECSPEVVRVPPWHRLRACARFLAYAAQINVRRRLARGFR